MNNQKGSALIENILSVCLLGIFSLMVFSVLLAGLNSLGRAAAANDRMYSIYNMIESVRGIGADSATSYADLDEIPSATMSFDVNGNPISIGGSFVYDEDEKKLGDFYRYD